MSPKEIVQSTVDFIEENLSDNLELDIVAEKIGYSKFYLNRLFWDTVGQTINKYIRLRRLTNSARQLVETDAPIIDIAMDAGYQSQQAYHHAFSAVFACTPTEYRLRALYVPARVKFAQSSILTMGGAAA